MLKSWLSVGLISGCLLLAGCRAPAFPSGPVEERDGPPTIPHGDLTKVPDPVPKQEPKSERGNPRSYEVFGQRYELMDSAAGYRAEGNASWYGQKFHGRTTSSGEPFDMFLLTAAHKTLPIPSYAEVTNLANGRKITVRINDRGPFHEDRILDLSYAAAVKLGFHEQGTARVRVEVVAPALDSVDSVAKTQADSNPSAGVESDASATSNTLVYLQAGAFRELTGAAALARSIRAKLPSWAVANDASADVVKLADDDLYRVRIGPVRGVAAAQRVRAQMIEASFAPPLILP